MLEIVINVILHLIHVSQYVITVFRMSLLSYIIVLLIYFWLMYL
jgi:hypothetical protein